MFDVKLCPGDWVRSRFVDNFVQLWTDIEQFAEGWRMGAGEDRRAAAATLNGLAFVVAVCPERKAMSDSRVYAVLLLVKERLFWAWQVDLCKVSYDDA